MLVKVGNIISFMETINKLQVCIREVSMEQIICFSTENEYKGAI